MQGELRSLAQKVAKATASKVAHDILRQGGAHTAHMRAHPSALKQLEAAAARTAMQRYGP